VGRRTPFTLLVEALGRVAEEGALDGGVDGCASLDDGLQAAAQGGAVEEHSAAAFAATDADVSTHADHVPVEAATRVLAAQAEDVADS
jgi:hypothetical protein